MEVEVGLCSPVVLKEQEARAPKNANERATYQLPYGRAQAAGELYAEGALAITRTHRLQRDVEVEVSLCSPVVPKQQEARAPRNADERATHQLSQGRAQAAVGALRRMLWRSCAHTACRRIWSPRRAEHCCKVQSHAACMRCMSAGTGSLFSPNSGGGDGICLHALPAAKRH